MDDPTLVDKAKAEVTWWGRIIASAHKNLTLWYCYLVGASTTLQASIPDLADYIPNKVRHWIIGGATLIVFIDKIRRSVPK